MRPISIRFKAFGPYREEQLVRFAELGSMFVISGETGAGKTTILDAICYALYDESSSGKRGDGLESMRCSSAEKKEPTEVEFIFEEHGRRYKFDRTVRMGRINSILECGCAEWAEGDWKPLLANPKKTAVTKEAERILNLTAEQFRQIIILPQGKFEDFLVSDEQTKETILKTIFGMERWDQASKAIRASVLAEEKKLGEEKSGLQARLSAYGCTGTAQLEEKLTEENAQLQVLNETMQKAVVDYTKANEALQKAIEENAVFEEFDKRKREQTTLAAQAPAAEKEDSILNLAAAAAGCRPVYDERNRRLQEKQERAGTQKKCAETLKEKNDALQTAKDTMEELEQKRPQAEQAKKDIARYEEKLEVYRKLSKQKADLDASQKNAEQAQKDCKTAEDARDRAQKAWEQGVAALTAARENTSRTLQGYLEGIGSELAQQLKEGMPCPVCGSREHPAPATHSEMHVTREQYEKVQKEEQTLTKREQTLRQTLDTAQDQFRNAERAQSDAEAKAAADLAVYTESLKSRVDGIETLEDLQNQIARLKRAIQRWEDRMDRTAKDRDNAALAAAEAKAAADNADREAKAAEDRFADAELEWGTRLKESPFSDEKAFLSCNMSEDEQRKRREALTTYRTKLQSAEERLEEQKKLLEGKLRPQMDLLRTTQKTAENEKTRLGQELARRKHTIEQMETDLEVFRKKETKLLEKDRIIGKNKLFAQRLCGEKGVGLQTFVLSTMMELITAEANRFLRDIYGGRYRLYRTDDKVGSGRKAGLNLVVEDREAMGENLRRPVQSLSGGEKFLVSLSLALGLSAVVQARASGVTMEAMFVDEGFGSLHASAVDDALDILNHVRTGKGMVGVITHVDRVVHTIGTGLEAVKTKNGSVLKRI